MSAKVITFKQILANLAASIANLLRSR